MSSAVTTLDEFTTFDYSSLAEPGSFYSYFMHPFVPIGAVVGYLLLSNVVFGTIKDALKLEPKGSFIQTLTIVHSLALAVYSGWTAYNSWQIVGGYIAEHGLWTSLCDTEGKLWTLHNAGWWVTHFYISKFYEFIDTWIILLKGRKPMFLQVYHHAGVVIIMWGFVVTKCTSGGVVILTLNSFIHTLMYTYYVAAAFGYRSPLKEFLTQAQLLQFFVGVGVTIVMYFIDGCINPAQSLALNVIHVYTIILIYLFGMFYYESYMKKKEKKEGSKKAK